ncbi:DUF192 domain-containing protein [Terasakiella sp. A23]|uniref:DUF192 domain-containing protein n=1 Tax=Terasakiella sp. FCG-A23 TaxID=3080561 RepID=UPI002953ECF7|nr:DUF192 domain-containing protein [Terasakiella sp. A23]MDV7338802.1 DUF192 domain-containing protein [Terasakiella sp. A23]
MFKYIPIKLFTGLFLFTILFTINAQAGGAGPITIVTNEGRITFNVEYAISPEEKAKGLMHRKSLPAKSGMLFIYQKPRIVTMWMKNTPMSLDMFFINRKGRIRYIEEKTQPNSTRQINSGGRISAVLELRGGSAEDFGIKVGDEVIIGK